MNFLRLLKVTVTTILAVNYHMGWVNGRGTPIGFFENRLAHRPGAGSGFLAPFVCAPEKAAIERCARQDTGCSFPLNGASRKRLPS
jgi:hypothetical protein